MRKLFAASVVLLMAGLLCTCQEGLAQKKKGKKEGVDASPQDYTNLASQKEVAGKLADTDGRVLTLTVEVQHMEPNPAFKGGGLPKGIGGVDLNRRYQEIIRDQIDIARAKSVAERNRRMAELRRDMDRLQQEIARAMAKAGGGGKAPMNGPFRMVTEKKNFELDLTEKAVFRRLTPPFEYDDKGDVKKLSKEELEKLRGTDPKLPGYTAKLEDLFPGQTVKFFLTPPAKDAKKTKLDEVEGVGGPRPTINMVMIIEDAGLTFGTAPKKKDKR